MKEKKIGKVTHFYSHLGVAIVDLDDTLKAGDKVHFIGHSTDFEQPAVSLEVDGKRVVEAKKKQSVGVEVKEKVREHDDVFRVE